MVIDISEFIQATSRAVEVKDGQKVLIASRSYPTGIADLWDALTNIDRIPRWFLPVSGDLKVGGRYQFEGNAGGEVLECEAPDRFYVTWEFGGQVSWVEIRLASVTGGTQLTLRHTALVPEEMWQQFGPGAVGIGWEMGFLGLAEYVVTGVAVAQGEGLTWMGSPEGKTAVRSIGDKWCDAAIAFGDDSKEARAAADRCAAAYTGEPVAEGGDA